MIRHILAVIIGTAITVIISCSGTDKTRQQQAKPITNTDSLLSYQDNISTAYMQKHLSVFSADSMKGRETGTPAEHKAARYLAGQYQKLGLQPVGDNGTYFQHFKLNATKTDSVVFKIFKQDEEANKPINRSVASKHSTADFIRQVDRKDTLSGEILFAGFGVQNSTLNINHLKGADLKGKWVMIFEDIPQVINGDTLYQNRRSFARSWVSNILQKGAKGILMIPDMSIEEFNKTARSNSDNFVNTSGLQLAYRPQNNQGPTWGYNIISPERAAYLIGEDSIEGLRAQKENILENITGFSASKTKYSLQQTSFTRDVTINSKNVLAFYEGADPKLKDEVVVLTSHYDHVGVGQPDSTGDRIYNGADDDGSGTIGLLNIARAFAKAGKNNIKPKRSILFLNVSAEEKGLLGSRYYSDHPVFSMDSTIANINTDMIGRVDEKHKKQGTEEYSYIIGGDIISSQLDSLVSAANKKSGQISLSDRYNDLQDPNQFYRRSDHWHFGRKGVPFVFFFSGVHEDYHRPSDEVHKIRFDKMSKIVRTMYGSAVLIANTENPPTVDNQAFIEITKSKN